MDEYKKMKTDLNSRQNSDRFCFANLQVLRVRGLAIRIGLNPVQQDLSEGLEFQLPGARGFRPNLLRDQ